MYTDILYRIDYVTDVPYNMVVILAVNTCFGIKNSAIS